MAEGQAVEPVGGENPNRDKLITNLVLASVHCWMQKGTRDLVHSAAKKGFIENDIKDAGVNVSISTTYFPSS